MGAVGKDRLDLQQRDQARHALHHVLAREHPFAQLGAVGGLATVAGGLQDRLGDQRDGLGKLSLRPRALRLRANSATRNTCSLSSSCGVRFMPAPLLHQSDHNRHSAGSSQQLGLGMAPDLGAIVNVGHASGSPQVLCPETSHRVPNVRARPTLSRFTKRLETNFNP